MNIAYNRINNSVKNIDLYVNYQCGLRCNHCFIGEHLDSNDEMPYNLVKAIIDKSKQGNVKSITLLGGEPTLHSEIDSIINYIIESQITLRIVTNGQKPCVKLIERMSENSLKLVHFCFSIDGANDRVNDSIRGKGTFKRLLNSIELAKSLNISISGITSISEQNKHDLFNIIDLCESQSFKYLNIHYVTDRGFAERKVVISHQEWSILFDKVKTYKTNISIRMEKTFVPIDTPIHCEVLKKENIIIDPKGKVYGCTIFMNFPFAESGVFSSNGFIENTSEMNENKICSCNETDGCPGISLTNKELTNSAIKSNLKIDCFFNKTLIETDADKT